MRGVLGARVVLTQRARFVHRLAGMVSAGRMRQLFSALGEDADGVVPVEAVANPAGGSRVGGDVGVFVFDRSRVGDELSRVDVVG